MTRSMSEQTYDEALVAAEGLVMGENPELAARDNIRSIPTILFVEDGEVVDQVVGAAPKAVFQNIITARAA
jgi:thioredoxin